jgi:hypothetical protein
MMLEELSKIDWDKLGAPEIPKFLYLFTLDYSSENAKEFDEAYDYLEERLAPFMLLHGYGNYHDLMKIMQTEIPHLVTPFLIQILETTNDSRVKGALLGLLHYECSYIYAVGSELRGLSDRDYYEAWAHRLRGEVERGLSMYENLLTDSESFVRVAAEDLINNINRAKTWVLPPDPHKSI